MRLFEGTLGTVILEGKHKDVPSHILGLWELFSAWRVCDIPDKSYFLQGINEPLSFT